MEYVSTTLEVTKGMVHGLAAARVEALQILCMIQPIFPLLRLKAEGQLGQLGQGSQ